MQGNLDPAVLLGPWERVEAAARDVLARAGGRPGHIFNLGHGVLPGTDPDVLGRLRELVHAETADDRGGTEIAHFRHTGVTKDTLRRRYVVPLPRVGGG